MLQRWFRSNGMAVLLAAAAIVVPSVGLGQAKIGSNANITLSGGLTVLNGSALAGGTVTASGGATVTGTITNGAPAVAFAAVTPCGPPYSPVTGISGGSFSYDQATGDLTQSGGGTVELAPGTYCFHKLTLSGGSILAITGATVINMTDKFNASGGSISNPTLDPDNLKINSSATTGVYFTGGSGTYMKVYAPASGVTLSGSSPFWGSIIGKTITATGGSAIHTMGVGSGVKLSRWHEVQN